MYDGYSVVVSQGNGSVKFEFVNQRDAIEFISTCMECGDEVTNITVEGLKGGN